MIAFAKDHHICLFKQSEYVFYGILSMFLKACLVLRNSSLCVCRENGKHEENEQQHFMFDGPIV